MKVAEIENEIVVLKDREDEILDGRKGAIVQVLGCGLCGSDIVKLKHKLVKNGTVLGHEIVAKIIEIDSETDFKKDDVTNKEIGKKIFSYALPFIIINIVSSCYNFIDLTLILRTMNYINLSAKDVEFAASAVTTWAPKINMIIASIAMGMSTSLIPTMVSAFTLNNWKEVNNKFNQALQILIFIFEC